MPSLGYTPEYETDWIEFKCYGYTHFKIQTINDQLRPMQRHVFREESGEIRAEDWIPAFYNKSPEKSGLFKISRNG